jgi:hypothetical protein
MSEKAAAAAEAALEADPTHGTGIIVKFPPGHRNHKNWLKEHLHPDGQLDGSVDDAGEWHPHVDFYKAPIVLTSW